MKPSGPTSSMICLRWKSLAASGIPREASAFSPTNSANRVGALHHALAAFRRYRINMTKIESRPSKRKAWEYFFFVDFLGHCEDAKVKKALGELAKHTMFIKILGSYPNVNG